MHVDLYVCVCRVYAYIYVYIYMYVRTYVIMAVCLPGCLHACMDGWIITGAAAASTTTTAATASPAPALTRQGSFGGTGCSRLRPGFPRAW